MLILDSRFASLLKEFQAQNSLIFSDNSSLRDDYTYVSDAWSTTSWIDHCLCTQDAHNAITDVLILHDSVTSDHLPLCINISMEAIPSTSTIVYDDVLTKLIWSNADMSTVDNYSTAVNRAISSMPLDI